MSDPTISCPLYEPDFCNELRFGPMRMRRKIGRAPRDIHKRLVPLERHSASLTVAAINVCFGRMN